MPQSPDESPNTRRDASPKSQRSVLAALGEQGLQSKILLPDSDSGHGNSPVVDPGASATKLVPQGRGNYQLLGEIARGGMGVILKGHDTDLGRDVAVKVLDGELAKRPAVIQRFVEEAQIGGQLQHPGIVPVYELGLMADERPYFTMKLVKGRTLAALLSQRKTPADNRGRLLSIFESVCQTMAYAHSKGVLHRDLKPANIMVGSFGEVQVVDWGLAKVLSRGGVADEKRAKQSTMNTVIETVRSGPGSSGSNSMIGSVMGTPAYMAPEQAQGEVEKLDERADVFSLGAILCEILTGRPPYEDVPGESTVQKAARAQLDPARERVQGCGADPALVQLCLDCLMPAKAARPTNAEEVAKSIHAYLTSTEERAHKAELEATEARIKAAEERRAKRLTLALGGTIVGALVLGGGGIYWVNKERAKHAEETRAAVETAFGESQQFSHDGRPDDALASARRAVSLAQTNAADAALVERAQQFEARAAKDVDAAAHERLLKEQDETLRGRLVDLRIGQIAALGNTQKEKELDIAFAKAFQDYGVDLEAQDITPALKRIRERKIAEDVALALDDWGRLRRKALGTNSVAAENLSNLAMDLDPDPERLRLRKAIVDNDLETLLALAANENLPKLAPGSIWVLSATLWDRFKDHRPDVYRMYDQARHIYPNDYVLQAVGGSIYNLAGRNEDCLACRTAAVALRPNDATARAGLVEALLFVGRWTEAEAASRACVTAYPTNPDGHYNRGMVQVQLGDFAGALASVTRALELQDDPARHADLLALRYRQGVAEKKDVIDAIQHEGDPTALVTYLYALIDVADPARRDPEVVLKAFEENPAASNAEWRWLVEGIARIRSADWNGALQSLGNHFTPPATVILSPAAFDFVRSVVHANLGHKEAAQECYARGMASWNALTGGNPQAWEKSDVMRWRREAEEALAK
jgi:serine/threonine-protein kinase